MSEILFERTINNLHDNGRISFKKIKEMLSGVSNFILEKGEVPKGKKVLLSFSVKEGKLVLVDNKTSIKNNKKNINEYLKICENLKEEIAYSLNNLENNINTMSQEDQVSIFGPDNNVFYNVEILTRPEKSLNYNTKHFSISPDGHGEYDKDGKMIVTEVSRQTNKLQELLNKWQNKLKNEKYNNYVGAFRKINELHDKEYYNYAANRIDNSLSSVNNYINNDKFNLSDDSTVDDYMLSRVYILLNALLEKSKTGNVDPIAKMNIAKRILGIKGIGMQDITKKLLPEQSKFIKENILNDKNKKDLLKNAIKPIEDVIINYTTDMLRAIQSILLISDNPSGKRLNKQIDNSINYINAGNGLNTLKHELKGLKHLDRYINKPKCNFYYDGVNYSTSEGFQPINELLKVFKPFSENTEDKKIIGENDIAFIINEVVVKRQGKYCLLSKKTKKNLGCYTSKAGAAKREKQVQYFKHIKEMSAASAGAVQGFAVDNDASESK